MPFHWRTCPDGFNFRFLFVYGMLLRCQRRSVAKSGFGSFTGKDGPAMTVIPRLTARRGSRRGKGRKSNLRHTQVQARNREQADRFAGTIKKLFFLFFLSLPLITLIQTVLGRTPDYRIEETRTSPGSVFGPNGTSIPSR